MQNCTLTNRLTSIWREEDIQRFSRNGTTKKLAALLQAGESKEDAMNTIFSLDVEEIRRSDILLIILDGRVPDEGACVELGIAYALNKTCIGLKTGPRHLMDNLDNPLITGAIQGKVARTIAELEQFI